ncbi:hypothetical protein LCGC14_2366970, partial [marine sediment metagenome]
YKLAAAKDVNKKIGEIVMISRLLARVKLCA